jgi:thiol-disulfide isomerase/thioredoxin
MTGQVVLVVAVTFAAVFGVWRWYTDGRVREARPERIPGIAPGDTATLVQFSSMVCAPCVTTRRLLSVVAEDHGIEHVDLDVEEHMDLVHRFGVSRTPTVLVLDGDGRVRHRISGVPRRAELEAALDGLCQTHREAG